MDNPEFLKDQLYKTFKKTGVLDSVKATLRNQLIGNLQASKIHEENKEPITS